jgi:hypothetical protein
MHLLIQDGEQLLLGGPVRLGCGGKVGGQGLRGGVGPGLAASAKGGAVGDAVQPAGERRAAPERACLPGEGEEGGLEGVLGVLPVAQEPAADAEHHGAVPPDEHLEGGLVAAGGEPFEEVAVLEAAVRPPGDETAQVTEDVVRRAWGHGWLPGRVVYHYKWREVGRPIHRSDGCVNRFW